MMNDEAPGAHLTAVDVAPPAAISAIIGVCRRFSDKRTSTQWEISPTLELTVTTTVAWDCHVVGHYAWCDSGHSDRVMFQQQSDGDGFCKRIVIRSETETTWIATLQANWNFPDPTWHFGSAFRIHAGQDL